MIKLLKVLGIIVAVVVILMATTAILLDTDRVQNWLMQRAVTLLKEQLQTEVSVGHVGVNLFKGSVTLSDVEVDDRQGRKMFRADSLTAALDLGALWRQEVVITDAHVSGLKAQFCKPASPTDSAANYQFLFKGRRSKVEGQRSEVEGQRSRKANKSISFHLETAAITIDSLCYTTDNGLPRRNTGKPHHGAFDAGHLDICAAMTLKLNQIENSESLHLVLSDCHVTDRGSGLQVDTLQLQADIDKDSLRLSDVEIRLPHTCLSFAEGCVVLPDSSVNRTLHYDVPLLTATTQIRDIAQPFAPTLKNFTTPLQVQCTLSGDDNSMDFKNVQVCTSDRRLDIKATGRIRQLRDKDRLHVHFDVGQMTVLGGMAETIINHFSVKKFMMKQLQALGRIGYRGHFDVVHKKESFAGLLETEHGDIDIQFAIDERDKYLSGTVSTDSLQLGSIMDMKDLGRIACSADFRFDISKPRTEKVRQEKGGKLPIGSIEAEVSECHYKSIAMHNLSATIESDGAEATGHVVNQGKHVDISCTFTFTDTDEMHKLKIKPGIKIH